MVYSDTTNKLGLLQDCEMKLFGDNGYGQITGNTNRLLQFTARINRAQDRFMELSLTADGKWQYDDTNNTDFPIATTNMVSGQQDYAFSVDMMQIEKVLILNASTDGRWVEISPFDIHDIEARTFVENNSVNTGVPYRYDKSANSIFLYPTPNYSATSGIKVYFKRGANYFISTDTTKSPGFASTFHKFLSAHASLGYAIDRSMPSITNNLASQVNAMETAITAFFGRRSEDEDKVLSPVITSFI